MNDNWTRELGRQRKEEQRRENDERAASAFALVKRVEQSKSLVAIGDERAEQADYDQTVQDAAGRRGY